VTFIHKALSGSQTVELFDRAARRAEGRIRRALLDALERVRDRETAAQLRLLVSERRVNSILELLDVGKGDDFVAFRAAISETVSDGAKLAVRAQRPVKGPDGRKIEFVFDSQNPRLATYAQQISGTRIREIGNDVREVIRTIVAQDTVNGINPRDTARRIKDSIGLTARQEAAVMNYRRALETMDPAALERELRDKRSDGAVRRAIADQKRLSQKQIDGMVDRYRQKYLAYRSRTIARTEATRSLNGANHELFQSYIDEGKIAKEQVRRFWTPTLDERTRMGHLEIPQLPGNENGVGQDEPFQSRFGPIMYPGDPNARPDNTINCRCTVFSRIVSMELLRPRQQPAAPPPAAPVPVSAPPTEPEPTFRYQTLKQPKNVKEAEQFIIDNKISKQASFKGIAVKNIGSSFIAMAEMHERFDIPPLDGTGPITRFGLSGVKGASAAFATTIFPNGDKKHFFHTPTKFGNMKDAEEKLLGQEKKVKAYAAARDARIASLEAVNKLDPELKDRLQTEDNFYGWSVSSKTPPPEKSRAATVYHEYGHVLHLTSHPMSDDINRFLAVYLPRNSGWDLLLSKYASSDNEEFIAEAMSVYMTHPDQHFRIHPKLLDIFKKYDKGAVDGTR